MEEQLEPSEWLFLLIQWPEQWVWQTSLQWRTGHSTLHRELLNGHRGHGHDFERVCNFRLSSSELRTWSSAFTRKFLLGHSLCGNSLLFIFSLFGLSVEGELRGGLPWEGSGKPGPCMHRTSQANIHRLRPTMSAPLLLCGMATSTQHRGGSGSHRTMAGRLPLDISVRSWCSALGSATTRRHKGPAWTWLAKVPGMRQPQSELL